MSKAQHNIKQIIEEAKQKDFGNDMVRKLTSNSLKRCKSS